MDELHTGPKHPLCGADPETYFGLQMIPPGCQPKGEGNCRYLAQYYQAYSGRVGGAHWPWSAAHLGEGNSDNKPIGRRDSSALVGNSPRRRKLRIQTYSERDLLALSQVARPWQLNVLLFSE